MDRRRLGHSELEITRIGLGAWAIGGGGWTYGWGPQDDAASIAAIRRAVERAGAERDLEIERDGGDVSLYAVYSQRIKLVGNVNACLDFEASSN